MDIRTFINRNALGHRLLDRLLSGRSSPFCTGQVDEWLFGRHPGQIGRQLESEWFAAFKGGVKSYARELYGADRLDLYLEVRDLIDALRDQGYVPRTVKYELKDSFLSRDEVNLIILKEMQEPITQDRLANDVLGCSRQTVGERLKELQDGYRLGDMSVKIAPERGGRLQSTVHPILLPLNLSEVYVLLSALGAQTSGLSREDPHWAILNDVAEKIYFQLTDYARDRIDGRLAEQGFHLQGDTPPIYVGDQHAHVRGTTGCSMSWAFFEKAHKRVEVICADGEGEESAYVGFMDGWTDASPYVDADAGVDPRHCFLVKDIDGACVAVSWENVVDIRSVPDGGDAPEPGCR